MKFLEKVHIKEGVLVKIFSLFVCLYLFNFLSCGLDMFYSIEAPTSYEIPSYTNTEYTSQTFIFYTNETWFPDAENPLRISSRSAKNVWMPETILFPSMERRTTTT